MKVERAESDGVVGRLDEDRPVAAPGLCGCGDPGRHAVGAGGSLSGKDAVVLHVPQSGEVPYGRRSRTRKPAIRRRDRRKHEHRGREPNGNGAAHPAATVASPREASCWAEHAHRLCSP